MHLQNPLCLQRLQDLMLFNFILLMGILHLNLYHQNSITELMYMEAILKIECVSHWR